MIPLGAPHTRKSGGFKLMTRFNELARLGAALALCAAACLPSVAEVELTLNVRGTADEIAAVLQLLKTAGLAGGGGVQVAVESTFALPAAVDDPGTPAATPAPAPPALTLSNPLLSPTAVKAGSAALLSIDAVDPERRIDTVAAIVGDSLLTVDLYDNGMKGDVAAGDGRWSVLLNVPATLPAGSYDVVFQAYDAQGALVTLPGSDGTPQVVTAILGMAVAQP